MNRRQKRALAKRIRGYKGLLNEASAKTIKQFEEMMRERWNAETQVLDGQGPANAAFSNKVIEDNEAIEGKENRSETKNAEGE